MINQTHANNLVLKIDIGADSQISKIEKCIQNQIYLQKQQPVPPILPILTFKKIEVLGQKHFQVTYDCTMNARSLLEIFKGQTQNIPKVELYQGLLEISQYLKSKNITHQNLTPSNLIVLNNKIYLNNFGCQFNLEKNFGKITDPLNWYPYLNKRFQLIQQKESNEERETMIQSLTDDEIIAQEQFALSMMRAQLFVPIPKKNSNLTLEDSINYMNDWVEGKYDNQGFVDSHIIEDIKQNFNPIIKNQQYLSSLNDTFFLEKQIELVLNNQIPPLERQKLIGFLQLPIQLSLLPIWIYYMEYEELINNQQLIAQQKIIDQNKFKKFLGFNQELYQLLKQNSLPFSKFEEFYQNLEFDHLKYLCLKSLDQELQVQPYFKGWGNNERKKLSQFYKEINDKVDIWKDIDMQNSQFQRPRYSIIRQSSIIQVPRGVQMMPQQPQPQPQSQSQQQPQQQRQPVEKIQRYSKNLNFESYYYFCQKQLLKAKDYYAFVDLNQQNSLQEIRHYDIKYLIIDGTIFIGMFQNGVFFGEIIRDVTQFVQLKNINQENKSKCCKKNQDNKNSQKQQEKRSRIIHYESIMFKYEYENLHEQIILNYIQQQVNSSQFNTRLKSDKIQNCQLIELERCFSKQDTEKKNFLELLWDKKFTKLHEYKGDMDQGKYQGQGEIINFDTYPVQKYIGDFKEGKKNGFGTLEVIDECIQKGDFYSYEGNFKDDKFHDDKGKIYLDYEKLVMQQGRFVNGKNVGIHTLYHRDKYGNTLKQTVKLFIPIFGCPITLQEIVSDD